VPIKTALTALRRRRQWLDQAMMIGVSACGGVVFAYLGLPAAWLSGGMVAVALLAAANRAVPLAAAFRQAALVFAGVGLGSGVTPAMLGSLSRYPASLAILAFALVAITFSAAAYLSRMPGWTRETAFFAALPGALSLTLTLAATHGADLRRVAIVQVLRVFVLIAVLPPLIGTTLAQGPPAVVRASDPPGLLLLVTGLAFVAGLALERIGVATGMLLGAIAVSSFAHASGFAPGRLPLWFQISGQVLVGAWTGSRFVGFDWNLLVHSLKAAFGGFVVSFLVAAACAGLATFLLAIPYAETLVAFAPGALEAMTILAFALGLDPLYVGSHHLARFFLIALLLPFLTPLIFKRKQVAGL
jgi:membrane AbrB-like protein